VLRRKKRKPNPRTTLSHLHCKMETETIHQLQRNVSENKHNGQYHDRSLQGIVSTLVNYGLQLTKGKRKFHVNSIGSLLKPKRTCFNLQKESRF